MTNIEGFSITHAGILDGTTGLDALNGDIKGVRSGTLDVDMDSYDNTGDDDVLSTWDWFNKATLTVQGGFIPWETMSLLTGSALSSSGTGVGSTLSMPLWESRNLNVRPHPVVLRVPAKDEDGVPYRLDFILYKVQFKPMAFDGPQYKSGLLVNYAGTALKSSKDEKGQPVLDSVTGLPSKSIGRLVATQLA